MYMGNEMNEIELNKLSYISYQINSFQDIKKFFFTKL